VAPAPNHSVPGKNQLGQVSPAVMATLSAAAPAVAREMAGRAPAAPVTSLERLSSLCRFTL
jgi:hypothetical protein